MFVTSKPNGEIKQRKIQLESTPIRLFTNYQIPAGIETQIVILIKISIVWRESAPKKIDILGAHWELKNFVFFSAVREIHNTLLRVDMWQPFY